MAIAYTWEVTGLKTTTVAGTADVVVQTYWKKTGTDDDGHTGSFMGATPFSAESIPTGSTFVPFSELTEDVVLEWIKAVVVGTYEEHVNGRIAEEIARKHNPVTDATLPWAPPSEPSPTPQGNP